MITLDEEIVSLRKSASKSLDYEWQREQYQIAEWLEELKSYKEKHEGWMWDEAEIKGYNKAIDDFAGRLIRYVDCGHLCSPTEMRWSDLSVVEMVKKLAEQLKAGD